ncbi:MAG: DUF3267 domain-containing protein [Cytophagales bacterium]|nr:MAG: DUF3267 domain-containing protein [Cytophagales bacterium]
MIMNISTEQLSAQGYQPFATLPHNDIATFIRPYMKKMNPYIINYHLSTFLPLVVWLGMIGFHWGRGTYNAELLSFFYGFSIAFLLIPLHELIHGLAYRLVGAKKVSYGANLKKFIFYALADKFVVSYKEFIIVALAPFLVVYLVNIILFLVLPTTGAYACLGLTFVHSLLCGGDFGLLSFFHENKSKQLVTYDDVAKQASYFYSLYL